MQEFDSVYRKLIMQQQDPVDYSKIGEIEDITQKDIRDVQDYAGMDIQRKVDVPLYKKENSSEIGQQIKNVIDLITQCASDTEYYLKQLGVLNYRYGNKEDLDILSIVRFVKIDRILGYLLSDDPVRWEDLQVFDYMDEDNVFSSFGAFADMFRVDRKKLVNNVSRNAQPILVALKRINSEILPILQKCMEAQAK